MNYEYWADILLFAVASLTVWVMLDSLYWGDYPLGNDGLSDNERADSAWRYETGSGSKILSSEEKQAIAAWQASKKRVNHD